jgi:hypothetical protein
VNSRLLFYAVETVEIKVNEKIVPPQGSWKPDKNRIAASMRVEKTKLI